MAESRRPTRGRRRAVDPPSGGLLARTGRTALARGDIPAAVESLEAAAARSPRRAGPHRDLGEAYLRADWPARARRSFDRALSLEPDSVEALRGRARALRRLGDLEGAVEDLVRAAALRPDVAGIWNEMAACFEGMGRLPEATRCYRRVVDQDPDVYQAWYNLGNSLADAGDHVAALASYDEALRLSAGADFTLHFNRGWVLARLGRLSESAESYRRALTFRRSDYRTWYNLGNVLLESGDADGARRSLRRAAAVERDDPEVWNNLGHASQACGREREAERCYRRAIQLSPRFHPAWNNLGNLHERAGRYDSALGCYERALAEEPEQPIYLLNRAVAHARRGDHERALDDLEPAIRSNSLPTEALEEIEAFEPLRAHPRYRRLLSRKP